MKVEIITALEVAIFQTQIMYLGKNYQWIEKLLSEKFLGIEYSQRPSKVFPEIIYQFQSVKVTFTMWRSGDTIITSDQG